MLKVFENFDFSRVGRIQSLLESYGIPTFIKNQYTSSVMGEVPFVEVCPQLFILDDRDFEQARRLIGTEFEEAAPASSWVCTGCGARIEGQFACCWRCGNEPAPA